MSANEPVEIHPVTFFPPGYRGLSQMNKDFRPLREVATPVQPEPTPKAQAPQAQMKRDLSETGEGEQPATAMQPPLR